MAFSVRFTCIALTCLIFTPTRLAQSRVDALGDPLPEGAIARVGTTRMRHFSLPDQLCCGLSCMAWSLDGKMIATTSFAGPVGVQARLWEIPSGKPLSVLENNEQYGPSFAVFSPDGKMLAAAGREKIILWDVATGKELGQLSGHKAEVDALAYLESGKTIVSVSRDGTVIWWDLVSRKKVREWHMLADEPKRNDNDEPFDAEIHNARFSIDGTILAVDKWWSAELANSMAIVLDLNARKELWREDTHGKGSIFAFASDGKRLAMSGGGISLRDVASGRHLAATTEPSSSWGMECSPNGKTVAISTTMGVVFWSPDDKVPLRKYSINESGIPTYSPDGKLVAVSSFLTLRLLDADSLKPVVLWPSYDFRDGSELRFSSDWRRLFVSVYDPTAWAYHTAAIDTATWRQHSEIPASKLLADRQAASPDHTLCVAWDGKHRDSLFDTKTAKVLAHLDAPDVGFNGQHHGFFSPRASLYVMEDLDGQKKAISNLFAIPSGKRLCQLPFEGYSLAWTFSADESRVAFVEWETGIIHVHATDTGKLLWKSDPAEAKCKWVWSALALSPDGNMLAAQTENAPIVKIWDLRTGKEHRSLVHREESRAACLAWSPDNRMLAVGGFGNFVRLWEVASAQLRREFRGHACPARCLAFLPDGGILVSGSEDGTLLVWNTLADE